MTNHTRELLLVAALGILLGREISAPRDVAHASSPPPASASTSSCDTWRVELKRLKPFQTSQQGLSGWEPFSALGGAVVYRQCMLPVMPKVPPPPPRSLVLGERANLSRASRVLATWIGKPVTFVMKDNTRKSGTLVSFQGTRVSLKTGDTRVALDMMDVRQAKLDK